MRLSEREFRRSTAAKLYALLREYKDVGEEKLTELDIIAASMKFYTVVMQADPEKAKSLTVDSFRLLQPKAKNRRSYGSVEVVDKPLTPEEQAKLKEEILEAARSDKYTMRAWSDGRQQRINNANGG